MGKRPNLTTLYTPETLQATIDEYFQAKADDKLIPGIEGLAAHIGITRRTLELHMNGDGKRDDSPLYDVLQGAEQKIRAAWEESLLNSKACTGPLFALKNTRGGHWQDQQVLKQDLTVNDFRGLFKEIQGSVITSPTLVSDDSSEDTGT
jgi:hypothetical protein